jgi:hypothetical protein
MGLIDRRTFLRSAALATAAGLSSSVLAAPPTQRLLVKGGVDPAAFADEMASADPDGQSDNGIAIQRTINRLSDEGGGKVVLRPGHYRFARLLVIPSNVVLEGAGRDATRLERISDDDSRSIIIGTYGPVISISPKLETRYLIEDATVEQTHVDLVDSSRAALFKPGGLVAIDGTLGEVPHGKGFWLPNVLGRIKAVDGARIHLTGPVDAPRIRGTYQTRDGNRPGIRRLNTGLKSSIRDSAGRTWPLFVAENAGIRGMTLAQSQSIGWFLPTLAVENCFVEDCRIIARGIGGNPVAHSRFERLEIRHQKYPLEFAYLSHDTLVKDVTFVQLADGESPRSQGIWVNSNEGGKRITFDNITRYGFIDMQSRPEFGIALFDGSVLKNSRIFAPSSQGAVAYRSSIINSTIVASTRAASALIVSDGIVEASTIRGGDKAAVLADSSSRDRGTLIKDTTIGGKDKRRSDFVLKNRNPDFTRVEATSTFFNRADPVIASLAASKTAVKAAKGATTLGLKAKPTFHVGPKSVWSFILAGTLTDAGNDVGIVIRIDGEDILTRPLPDLAGAPFSFEAELRFPKPGGDDGFSWRSSLTGGPAAGADTAKGVGDRNPDRIRTAEIVIVGAAPAAVFTPTDGRITARTIGTRV